MCGIAGIVLRERDALVDRAALRRMGDRLAHRGPDGDGTVVLGQAGLAHRRLAIVDCSPAGAQPMANVSGTTWVVYNGEFYNYREERARLAAAGYQFRSRSDTEVLLALYEVHGAACLDRIEGMFAFAIWDASNRTLFLARDRFGKKPLYYQPTGGSLRFASEIKALLACAGTAPPIDAEAIHHFLSFDYVPGPRTAFQGILKLPPGHHLTWRDGQVRVARYFDPRAVITPAPDAADAASELRDRLTAAVRRRLIGERRIGVFLSGGIDSSAVVALLAGAGVSSLPTFTMAFREASHDERKHARLVAQRFSTDHHEWEASADLAAELPRIVRHYDEPFGDPSAVPTWLLARETSRHVTAVLTGDGGDEAFAGYDRYVKNALSERYLRLPRPLRRAAAAAVGWMDSGALQFEHPLRRLARFAALDRETLEELYGRWLLHFDAAQKDDLYTSDFRSAVNEDSASLLETLLAAHAGADRTARELAADTASYLPDDLLVKIDVATMAHSLEARCPFLDTAVVACARALPSSYKLRGLQRKWILKRAMKAVLPAGILRRSKQGFGLPIGEWLRGELRPLVHDLLLGRRAAERGLFRPQAVRRLVEEHERGVRQWQFHLWNLLVLELWYREVVETAAQRPAVTARPREAV